jgi:Mn-dependent DtxR family transcriptional regulator
MTDTQTEYYLYLLKHVEDHGYQPSYKEMAEVFGVTPKSVKDIFLNLEAQGVLELGDYRQERSIRLKGVKFWAYDARLSRPPCPKCENA